MGFFDNLCHTLAVNKMQKALDNSRLQGMPKKSARNSSNFKVTCKKKRYSKDYDIYKVRTNCDGLEIEWQLFFVIPDNAFYMEINAKNLNLSYSTDGMRMIKEAHPGVSFSFMNGWTYMTIKKMKVDSWRQVGKFIKHCEKLWNDSGLYKLLRDLKNLK